jgi:hypothetical protein
MSPADPTKARAGMAHKNSACPAKARDGMMRV